MQGKIVKVISKDYTVYSEGNYYVCGVRGIYRYRNIKPLVGDNVVFNTEEMMIDELVPRSNYLIRPSIANVDQAVIIASLKEPEFSANLLDKLLSVMEYSGVKAVICFTKIDLVSHEELNGYINIIKYYKSIGYECYLNNDIEEFKNIFNDKVSVFTGQTGAGKSTLLNTMDSTLDIKTNVISKALGRGKHTTRHVSLIPLFGGLIADTPGFSSISLDMMKKEDVRGCFVEFMFNCKYRGCMHVLEDGCDVIRRVELGEILLSRYESYISFIKEFDREF